VLASITHWPNTTRPLANAFDPIIDK